MNVKVIVFLLYVFQKIAKLTDCKCSVTYLIFNFIAQLGKCLFVSVGSEYGIITKTRITLFFVRYFAFYDSFE